MTDLNRGDGIYLRDHNDHYTEASADTDRSSSQFHTVKAAADMSFLDFSLPSSYISSTCLFVDILMTQRQKDLQRVEEKRIRGFSASILLYLSVLFCCADTGAQEILIMESLRYHKLGDCSL